MRVHEYAKEAGLTSANVLDALEAINGNLSDEEKIVAESHTSSLDLRAQSLLDEHFAGGSGEATVEAVFGPGGPRDSGKPAAPVIDALAEEDAVDEAFGGPDGNVVSKEIPMRRYALWGRRNKGSGPDEIKRVQDANDESEAINLCCASLNVNPSHYKFWVKRVKELKSRTGRGTPLPARESLRSEVPAGY